MRISKKQTTEKRRWPYLFGYEYHDEDREVIYKFLVLADINRLREHETGMDGYEDFDFVIASLESITVKGECDGEPNITVEVTDDKTCSAYCDWFQKKRCGEFIHGELQERCIEEYEYAHEPESLLGI